MAWTLGLNNWSDDKANALQSVMFACIKTSLISVGIHVAWCPLDAVVHVSRHRRGHGADVGVLHWLFFLPLQRRRVVGVGARCPLDAVVHVPRRRRGHDVDVDILHWLLFLTITSGVKTHSLGHSNSMSEKTLNDFFLQLTLCSFHQFSKFPMNSNNKGQGGGLKLYSNLYSNMIHVSSFFFIYC